MMTSVELCCILERNREILDTLPPQNPLPVDLKTTLFPITKTGVPFVNRIVCFFLQSLRGCRFTESNQRTTGRLRASYQLSDSRITRLHSAALWLTLALGIAVAGLTSAPVLAMPPVCSSDNADPDGDGYGWENSATCVVAGSQAEVDANTPDSEDTLAACASLSSDPDGCLLYTSDAADE